jgi:hypothetical protein
MLKKALLHPPCLKRAGTRSFPSFVLGSTKSSTYSHGKERVLARLGWVGVIGTPAVSSLPAASLETFLSILPIEYFG